MKTPRKLSVCTFSDKHLPEAYRGQYPMNPDHNFIFFGECPNMKGHCVVMDMDTGKFYSGYHIEHFTELDD